MTVAGKIVTMLYAIFYVPLFLYAMNILFQANFRRIHHEDVAIEREMYHVEKDVEIILSDTSHKKKTDIARKKRHLIAEK